MATSICLVDPFWKTRKGRALEASRKKVPRFLFRYYTTESGGGIPGLNSPDAIIPHAFLNRAGHQDITQIPFPMLCHMTYSHLTYYQPRNKGVHDSTVVTEFSSWTSSIPLVLQAGLETEKNGVLTCICIIDRYRIDNVKIFHVKSLCDADIIPGIWPWEYLAHGIVKGEGLKVVPASQLVKADIRNWIPEIKLSKSFSRSDGRSWWTPTTPGFRAGYDLRLRHTISYNEATALRNIAASFGEEFTLPVFAALLTIKRRVLDYDSISQNDIIALRSILEGVTLPRDYGKGRTGLAVKGIYTTGYPHIKQMNIVLREFERLEALRSRSLQRHLTAREKREFKEPNPNEENKPARNLLHGGYNQFAQLLQRMLRQLEVVVFRDSRAYMEQV